MVRRTRKNMLCTQSSQLTLGPPRVFSLVAKAEGAGINQNKCEFVKTSDRTPNFRKLPPQKQAGVPYIHTHEYMRVHFDKSTYIQIHPHTHTYTHTQTYIHIHTPTQQVNTWFLIARRALNKRGGPYVPAPDPGYSRLRSRRATGFLGTRSGRAQKALKPQFTKPSEADLHTWRFFRRSGSLLSEPLRDFVSTRFSRSQNSSRLETQIQDLAILNRVEP